MKKLLILIIIIVTIGGCATKINPFSPSQNLKNSGQIGEIMSNQNGLIAEIGKLKQDLAIMNSQLSDIQNGLLNINSSISRNDNSGIQVLQGDGSLILVFGTIMLIAILFYRNKYVKNEEKLSLLTKEIVKYNNSYLNENILKSAEKKGKGKEILKMMMKEVN